MKYHKTYVEYIDMRRFFPEPTSKQITERDAVKAKDDCPSECCGFRFFDIEYEKATTESGEKIEAKHRKTNVGPWFYLAPATVFSLKDIEKMASENPSRYEIAYRNMICNGMNKVLRTRSGNLVHFKDGDTIV